MKLKKKWKVQSAQVFYLDFVISFLLFIFVCMNIHKIMKKKLRSESEIHRLADCGEKVGHFDRAYPQYSLYR